MPAGGVALRFLAHLGTHRAVDPKHRRMARQSWPGETAHPGRITDARPLSASVPRLWPAIRGFSKTATLQCEIGGGSGDPAPLVDLSYRRRLGSFGEGHLAQFVIYVTVAADIVWAGKSA